MELLAKHFQLPLLSLELHACLVHTQASAFMAFYSFSSEESKILEDVQYHGTDFPVDKAFPVGFYYSCD